MEENLHRRIFLCIWNNKETVVVLERCKGRYLLLAVFYLSEGIKKSCIIKE